MYWRKTRVLVFLFIQLCWSYEREPLSLRGVVYPSPTPLPLPTPTPTPTPSPSSTPSPSPTITSSPTITITPSMTPTPTSTPTSTPSLTPTPSITPTPTPFIVLTPSPIVTLPPSPTPSENPTPTVTITATTTSLPTLTPQATTIPSPTPMVSSFTITSTTTSTSASEQDTNNNFFPITGGSVDITIVDQDGNDVVIIIADSDVLTGNVSVSVSNSSDSNIVSDIVTIDLDDNNQPNGDVELCFYVEKQDVRKLKLASFDPKDDCWQEEDNVKERETRTNRITGKKEVLVCGEVDHFTDFSILLDNEDGGADVCSDEAVEDSIAILLIVLASVAATLSVFSVGFIIATYLWNERFRHLIQGTEATRVEQLRKINKMIEIEEEEDEEDDKLSNRIINQSVPPV